MKKDTFYTVSENEIIFTKTGNHCKIPLEAKTEVIISPIQKNLSDEVLNTISIAASNSVANGNERVNVAVQIVFQDGTRELLQLNETPLVRNNLDYHETVRHARNLQQALKKDLAG